MWYDFFEKKNENIQAADERESESDVSYLLKVEF